LQCFVLNGEDSFMSRKWAAGALILVLGISGTALAQNNAATAGTPGVAVQSPQLGMTGQSDTGETVTPNAPLRPVPGDGPPSTASEPTTPNAPVQAQDEGPVPAGTEAGTPTAAAWLGEPVVIGAVGAAVAVGAVCLAACGGGSHTSSTTTTTPK
jgi:hypothetical protein